MPAALRIGQHADMPQTMMERVQNRKKPFMGIMMHWETDSILTGSNVAAPPQSWEDEPVPSCIGPMPPRPQQGVINWPPKASAETSVPKRPSSAVQTRGVAASSSRLSAAHPTSACKNDAGDATALPNDSLLAAQAPSRISMSASALGEVLRGLPEDRDGLVSKAEVYAALRTAPSRSRPSSAVERGNTSGSKARPSSASCSRQRSVPSLRSAQQAKQTAVNCLQRAAGEAKEATRILRQELGMLNIADAMDKRLLVTEAHQPMKKLLLKSASSPSLTKAKRGRRTASRKKTSEKTDPVRKQTPPAQLNDMGDTTLVEEEEVPNPRRIPTPSVLNLSRSYTGFRDTTCW